MTKKIVSFRLSEKSIELLNKLVNQERQNKTQLIEKAILNYYYDISICDKEREELKKRIEELEKFLKTKETLENICNETIKMKDEKIKSLENEIERLKNEIKKLEEQDKKKKKFLF